MSIFGPVVDEDVGGGCCGRWIASALNFFDAQCDVILVLMKHYFRALVAQTGAAGGMRMMVCVGLWISDAQVVFVCHAQCAALCNRDTVNATSRHIHPSPSQNTDNRQGRLPPETTAPAKRHACSPLREHCTHQQPPGGLEDQRRPWHLEDCVYMGENWVSSHVCHRLELFGTLI